MPRGGPNVAKCEGEGRGSERGEGATEHRRSREQVEEEVGHRPIEVGDHGGEARVELALDVRRSDLDLAVADATRERVAASAALDVGGRCIEHPPQPLGLGAVEGVCRLDDVERVARVRRLASHDFSPPPQPRLDSTPAPERQCAGRNDHGSSPARWGVLPQRASARRLFSFKGREDSMDRKMVWGMVLPALTAVLACSSSSSGSGSGSVGACAQGLSGNSAGSACGTCEGNNCASQIGGIESGCSDYLSCICPGGTFNQSQITACASEGRVSGSCTSASAAMTQCEQDHCATACLGGGTSSSGGASSSGGSTSPNPTILTCNFPATATRCTAKNECIICRTGSASNDMGLCMGGGGSVVTSCPTARTRRVLHPERGLRRGLLLRRARRHVGHDDLHHGLERGTWSTTP